MSELAAQVQHKLDSDGLPAALKLCTEHLQQIPDDADAHRHLGQLHALRGDRMEAMHHAQRACELAPDDPRSWSDLGRVFAGTGRLDEAVRCFVESVDCDPRYADGWHNLGTALKKQRDHEGAFKALKMALRLEPTRAATYLNLGNLLIEAGQFEDAVECFERASHHDPQLATARSRLAEQLSQSGAVKRAENLFRQSVGLDPSHTRGWFGLGRTLEDVGDAENALACYEQVLARQPAHAMALGQYLALVKSDAPAFAERANALLDDANTKQEPKALIGYGLAKYFDRRKQFADAAKAGLAANAARRQINGPLDRAALVARIDAMIAHYDQDFFHQHRQFGMGTDQPVFIVGLPRSGTTLTEQIIASHPLLHGAGELPDLARLATQNVADDQLPWQVASLLDQHQSRGLALRYLRALRNGAPKKMLRISDKSPLNFFHMAFAATLFPNARVIHCVRDARDNALSIWMENFNQDQRYATDFDDLAFYRSQYERLMAHWREHLPLPTLELHYEDLVADIETQAKRLIDFLGTPWDPACLNFHESERAVQTPSRWQVRQPVYTKSVQRWRAYAEFLPRLEAAFGGGRQR
jgi:tetratricopeptide (TPR) repeat protein